MRRGVGAHNSTVDSFLASGPAARGSLLGVQNLFHNLMLQRFVDSGLLREQTVQRVIVDRTHQVLVSGKPVVSKGHGGKGVGVRDWKIVGPRIEPSLGTLSDCSNVISVLLDSSAAFHQSVFKFYNQQNRHYSTLLSRQFQSQCPNHLYIAR